MTNTDDLELIRNLIRPLAAKAGLFYRTVMAMVTEENMGAVYREVGEKGIRDAAEAIVRVGRDAPPPPRTRKGRNE